MTAAELEALIDRAAANPERIEREEVLALVDRLLAGLESGELRAAEPTANGWVVHAWVKRGILLGFRVGRNAGSHADQVLHFRDRETFPTWDPNACERNVRIVPGGSSVRRGAFLGDNVVVMPPAYVNVGAYIGRDSMVDSHALVGSCAQVGARVHLSAAAQVGGVLEPVGALPVVIEDDVFVGGNCGIYEGTQIRRGAVLASGVVLTRSVPVYDLVQREVYRADSSMPLIVPAGAVVVPGSRPANDEYGREHGLQLQTPVIVKYRDRSTDAASALESALR